MNSAQGFTINQEIVYREEDDGAFLFDPDSGNLKYLNLTGKETFLMLEEEGGVGKAINHMQREHPDVDQEQIRKDMEMFLEQLKENGFVTPRDRE